MHSQLGMSNHFALTVMNKRWEGWRQKGWYLCSKKKKKHRVSLWGSWDLTNILSFSHSDNTNVGLGVEWIALVDVIKVSKSQSFSFTDYIDLRKLCTRERFWFNTVMHTVNYSESSGWEKFCWEVLVFLTLNLRNSSTVILVVFHEIFISTLWPTRQWLGKARKHTSMKINPFPVYLRLVFQLPNVFLLVYIVLHFLNKFWISE